jgi:hypothetical protein
MYYREFNLRHRLSVRSNFKTSAVVLFYFYLFVLSSNVCTTNRVGTYVRTINCNFPSLSLIGHTIAHSRNGTVRNVIVMRLRQTKYYCCTQYYIIPLYKEPHVCFFPSARASLTFLYYILYKNRPSSATIKRHIGRYTWQKREGKKKVDKVETDRNIHINSGD